jgi:hypothetical protein
MGETTESQLEQTIAFSPGEKYVDIVIIYTLRPDKHGCQFLECEDWQKPDEPVSFSKIAH